MDEMNVVELTETLERLAAAAEKLEATAGRIAEREAANWEDRAEQQAGQAAEQQETVGRIVATVDVERELERRLEQAEAKIVELSANAAAGGRKTLPAGMASMLAKQGVMLESGHATGSIEAGALDGALGSLSIEQRIAVKAELMRAGLLG